MTASEVAKCIMKATRTTQTTVSEKGGFSGQGAVAMALRSNSMRVDTFLRILNVCGYELVARSADGKTPEYVVGDQLSVPKKKEADPELAELIRRMVAEELAKGTPGRDE